MLMPLDRCHTHLSEKGWEKHSSPYSATRKRANSEDKLQPNKSYITFWKRTAPQLTQLIFPSGKHHVALALHGRLAKAPPTLPSQHCCPNLWTGYLYGILLIGTDTSTSDKFPKRKTAKIATCENTFLQETSLAVQNVLLQRTQANVHIISDITINSDPSPPHSTLLNPLRLFPPTLIEVRNSSFFGHSCQMTGNGGLGGSLPASQAFSGVSWPRRLNLVMTIPQDRERDRLGTWPALGDQGRATKKTERWWDERDGITIAGTKSKQCDGCYLILGKFSCYFPNLQPKILMNDGWAIIECAVVTGDRSTQVNHIILYYLLLKNVRLTGELIIWPIFCEISSIEGISSSMPSSVIIHSFLLRHSSLFLSKPRVRSWECDTSAFAIFIALWGYHSHLLVNVEAGGRVLDRSESILLSAALFFVSRTNIFSRNLHRLEPRMPLLSKQTTRSFYVLHILYYSVVPII